MKQPYQVLIVEDELLIAIAIEEALIGAGFSVCGIADSYDEAIRLIGRTKVNAAIVDVNLAGNPDRPGPDGVATARALLRQIWMPLIYLTGTTDEATFERAKATNPFAFLNKPMRPQELVQQLQLAMHNFEQTTHTPNQATAESIYLPTEQGYARVQQEEIQYLEAARNFTAVYLTGEASRRIMPANKPGQPLMLTGNLGYWGNHLSTSLFHRLSKSLMINLTHVDRVEPHQLTLGTHTLSLPDGARRALLDRLHVVRTR